MIVKIDQNFVFGACGFAEYFGVIEGDQIECFFRQTILTEGEQLGIEKFAVNSFNPAALAADIPGRAQMAGAVFEFDGHPITGFKPAGGGSHGSPHLDSNTASFLSISSLVRIFFSIRIASMLAIQRS